MRKRLCGKWNTALVVLTFEDREVYLHSTTVRTLQTRRIGGYCSEAR
jgi:hypothetical protein